VFLTSTTPNWGKLRSSVLFRDYDLNEIEYNSQNRCLVITGGIPIRVQIQVTSLCIEVL
jgi:hypothetical protein